MNLQRFEQPRLITVDDISSPTTEVLNSITIINKPLNSPQELPTSLKESLDNLFPEQYHENKTIQKVKEVLGDLTNAYSPVELKDTVIKIQYLAESWLDDFEREIFYGKTLQELLHEKGGL